METITRKHKNSTLKKQISFRVLDDDFKLIQEVKSNIDSQISNSEFLRFLLRESLHFKWYNNNGNPNNLKNIQ